MYSLAISHARLMRESTDRVAGALRSDDSTEQMIARRLLENPATWSIWESEHSDLMRQVAVYGLRKTQAAILKKAAFRLIHRKALFEYLRNDWVRGDMRRRIVEAFHPTWSYSRAVIAEHGVYLRKACSYLCTSHVGSGLVHDVGFLGPMARYEALYGEYFDAYCRTYFGDVAAEEPANAVLLPLLKYELDQCREAITNPTAEMQRLLEREAELRKPTGDTMRLPRLRLGRDGKPAVNQ